MGGSYISEFAAWKKANPAGLPRGLKAQHVLFKSSGLYQPVEREAYVPRPRAVRAPSAKSLAAANTKALNAAYRGYRNAAKAAPICNAKRKQFPDLDTIANALASLQYANASAFE